MLLKFSFAGVAELADATDLKSVGAILVGSSPTLGTTWGVNMPELFPFKNYWETIQMVERYTRSVKFEDSLKLYSPVVD